jgi:hypothetical protein
MFRDLRADEIEVRVALAKQKGVSLLLYKDARVDQNILDETVGAFNWMRSHSRDNANCIVSIWDEAKKQWISKEDTGVESNTEKEKGLASDSFKRACFNWGIGRELYTAPFIWIDAKDIEKLEQDGNRWKCGDSFEVHSITIENKRITSLEIINTKNNKIVYPKGKQAQAKQETPKQETPRQTTPRKNMSPRDMLAIRLKELGINSKEYAAKHGLSPESKPEDFEKCLKELNRR